MLKERKSRPFGHYLLFAWIVFLYLFAGYYALHVQRQAPPIRVEMAVPQDFHARLKKHGLDKQLSVIEISNGKLYFYRDGKRCRL
jgi:hypothetical protein